MSLVDVSPAKPVPSFVRLWQRRRNTVVSLGALVAYAGISHLILATQDAGRVYFRVDLSPLLSVPFALQIHIASALTAFLIGIVLLAGVKGRTFHRVLGYVWVAAMAATAISTFFLTGLNGDSYSLIHLLSGWTVIVLPMAVAAARRRDIARHRKDMTGLFFGGMLVAGLFSFLPGRMMWHLFFTV